MKTTPFLIPFSLLLLCSMSGCDSTEKPTKKQEPQHALETEVPPERPACKGNCDLIVYEENQHHRHKPVTQGGQSASDDDASMCMVGDDYYVVHREEPPAKEKAPVNKGSKVTDNFQAQEFPTREFLTQIIGGGNKSTFAEFARRAYQEHLLPDVCEIGEEYYAVNSEEPSATEEVPVSKENKSLAVYVETSQAQELPTREFLTQIIGGGDKSTSAEFASRAYQEHLLPNVCEIGEEYYVVNQGEERLAIEGVLAGKENKALAVYARTSPDVCEIGEEYYAVNREEPAVTEEVPVSKENKALAVYAGTSQAQELPTREFLTQIIGGGDKSTSAEFVGRAYQEHLLPDVCEIGEEYYVVNQSEKCLAIEGVVAGKENKALAVYARTSPDVCEIGEEYYAVNSEEPAVTEEVPVSKENKSLVVYAGTSQAQELPTREFLTQIIGGGNKSTSAEFASRAYQEHLLPNVCEIGEEYYVVNQGEERLAIEGVLAGKENKALAVYARTSPDVCEIGEEYYAVNSEEPAVTEEVLADKENKALVVYAGTSQAQELPTREFLTQIIGGGDKSTSAEFASRAYQEQEKPEAGVKAGQSNTDLVVYTDQNLSKVDLRVCKLDEKGNTAEASQAQKLSQVEELAEQFIKRGVEDPHGRALATAIYAGNMPLIDKVLEVKDPHGRVLAAAIYAGNMLLIEELLNAPEVKDPHGRALAAAIYVGNNDLVEKLFERGDVQDPFGLALAAATEKEDAALIERLRACCSEDPYGNALRAAKNKRKAELIEKD